MEWDKLWAYNKDYIDPISPRYTAIVKETSAKIIIDNFPDKGTTTVETHPLHLKNEALGTKAVLYGENLWVEKGDASEVEVVEPPAAPLCFLVAGSRPCATRSSLLRSSPRSLRSWSICLRPAVDQQWEQRHGSGRLPKVRGMSTGKLYCLRMSAVSLTGHPAQPW